MKDCIGAYQFAEEYTVRKEYLKLVLETRGRLQQNLHQKDKGDFENCWI